MDKLIVLVLILPLLASVVCQKDPHFIQNRTTIVHLFEWKWKDIANECEHFLQHKGYGGVQISPPSENLILKNRPWYERYQIVSYKLETRSGNQNEFKNMVKRCNDVGVRIYVDAVINHMTAADGIGTGGSRAFSSNSSYPEVPYSKENFHQNCGLNNFDNSGEVRNCDLVGLRDLDLGQEYVRNKVVNYMNHLIDLGVGGFRVDAAKHIWPADLKVVYGRLKNLNTKFGFPRESRPFIYQEVTDGGAGKREEYTGFGRVTEFRYGRKIGNAFMGNDKLTYLNSWGEQWNLLPSEDAFVFVDNHDNQRGDEAVILNYKNSKRYKMATAFMLAHPFGAARVMSSYTFNNHRDSPPMDSNENLLSPGFNNDDTCINGWVCEHRWRQIYNMVQFRNVAKGTKVTNWWSNGDQQISFCRGNSAFIAFTNWGKIDQRLKVCVPSGTYCDIISGNLVNGKCTGKVIHVRNDLTAHISLSDNEEDGMIAFHVNSKQQ